MTSDDSLNSNISWKRQIILLFTNQVILIHLLTSTPPICFPVARMFHCNSVIYSWMPHFLYCCHVRFVFISCWFLIWIQVMYSILTETEWCSITKCVLCLKLTSLCFGYIDEDDDELSFTWSEVDMRYSRKIMLSSLVLEGFYTMKKVWFYK